MKKAEYLIVGDGKTAKHISHYFNLLDVPYNIWNRKFSIPFSKKYDGEEKILVLISDDKIEEFIEENKSKVSEVTWIHFSGSLSTPLAESAHPLMTFHNTFYDLDFYQSIPFVTEKGRKSFSELFPGLPNRSYEIESSQKSFYHAWCSVAGNFTSILWSGFFDRLESKLNLPKEIALPYLEKITSNIAKNPKAVTGPIARGDSKTIDKHLEALTDDEFKKVYESFLEIKSKTMKESL